MKIAVNSDRGLRRAINEDAAGYFYNKQRVLLMIVCDGIGGHNAGDVASEMAISHLGRAWELTTISEMQEIHQWLVQHIRQENDRIYQKSQSFVDLRGMGTTLVAAVFVKDTVLVANVGDSRAYLFRNFTLKQVTEDHSLVEELVKNGEITKDEALIHPQRNYVTRSLGVSYSVDIDFIRVRIQPNDILLLCSDGLSNMVTDDQIQYILTNYSSVEEQVAQAIKQANQAGGVDNISVLIAKYTSEDYVGKEDD